MIEEILVSLQDKLRSTDFIDNDTALDKFSSLLQSQSTDKQRKIISSILPLALSSKFEAIQKKTVQIVINFPTVLKDILPALRLSTDNQIKFWAFYLSIQLGFLSKEELLEIVKSRENDDIRMLAMEFLAKTPDKQIIMTLLELISDPSWIIKRSAKKLLIDQGDSIYQYIQEYFMTCPSRQKYDCIKIIPLVLKEKAFYLFQKMLEADTKGIIKPFICAGLAEIKTDASLQLLIEMLQDTNALVREEAIKAISNWGREVIHPLLSIFPSANTETKNSIMILIGRILGLDAVKVLTEYFGHLNNEAKYFIMTALSQVRDDSVVKELIPYLKDDSVFIQEYAVRILSTMGVRVLDPLLALLDSEDEKILLPTIRVLGEIGSKEALRPLLYIIDNSKNTLVRCYAIEAIAKLQKFETVAGLLLLKLDDKDPTIRQTIIENLSKHPREAYLRDLVLACLDRNLEVSRGAREILLRRDYIGAQAFLSLYDSATDFEKDKIVSLVSKLSSDQFDMLLKKEKITLESLQPENLEIRVHKRKYTKENITDIKELLYFLHEERGSDLHLNIGLPPSIRIHGDLIRTTFETITPEKSRYLLYSLMNDAQKKIFAEKMEIDFSFEIPDCARFRANVFMQKNGMAAVFRIIPNIIPTFEELSLDPEIMKKICSFKNGLILVTGATGSGKSTTLAAMIDYINRTRYDHIITIEDPIEFVHQHKRSVITQRELGTNTLSFSNALRSALREDPDVILVGEMRDYETMHLAITAAETGHLVFSTLHTINAYESIHRIIGSFPGDQQHTIRMQLAGSLRAIISQRLIPAYLQAGRVLAYEILIANQAVKRCIKEDKIDQIISIMQTSRNEGMITMDTCLEELVVKKKITFEDGLKNAEDKKEFEKRVSERLGLKLKPSQTNQESNHQKQNQSQVLGKPAISTTPQVKTVIK